MLFIVYGCSGCTLSYRDGSPVVGIDGTEAARAVIVLIERGTK